MPSPVPPPEAPRRAPWLTTSASSAPAVSRLWRFTGPVLAALVVAIITLAARPVPYVTLSPGGAQPVESLIQIKSRKAGPVVTAQKANKNLLYLTVSLRNPSGIRALWGVLEDKVQVVPRSLIYGTQTSEENQRFGIAEMTNSQDKARKVALERLGYDVKSTPVGVFIEDADPRFPVARVMHPGATVTEADGHPVRTADQLVAAIQAHRPGQTMRLTFFPIGEAEATTATVKLGRRDDDRSKAALGITPVDRSVYTFPINVKIDTEQVGGPSAGLAFTLAILDRLTPGSLLGPNKVAVTGTIELDGSVGPVGGVDHKAEAAIEQGATLMIVPPDEYDLARKAAHGRLEVVKAATLDQALQILRRH